LKDFIYILCLSAGAVAAAFKNTKYFFEGTKNQITPRYYSDEFPAEFRHKYFLVTAGHHYKNDNFLRDFGLEDSFVFGDSGGYQICKERIKLTDELVRRIFGFLENNSTVAANLDIPPKGTIKISFQESLDLSYKNFTYFADEQTGKTKYLNVLHGTNPAQVALWYDKVKGMPFNGWACGSVYQKYSLLYTIAHLLENGEFSNPNNEYVHFFGLSSPIDFLVCAKLQKCLNKYGSHVTITTDSSSPSLNGLYGTYTHGLNYRESTWSIFKLLKCSNIDYDIDEPLPCPIDCPICNSTTYQDFKSYSTLQTQYIVLHNTMMYVKYSKLIQKLIYTPTEILDTYLSKDVSKMLGSIELMFESGTPLKIFNKFSPFYSSFDSSIKIKNITDSSFF